ncbi:MAG TPA: nitroreductase [Negativicutes bacterium]
MMNVSEALQTRRSCRAFKPDPVDRDTLLAILNDTLRAPSWGNTQPWEIWVAGGELLTEINRAYLANKKDHVSTNSDIPRPIKWTADANVHMKKFISDISHVADDAAKMFSELNEKFFYAPVVIYLCMDKSLTSWSMFDLGGLSQSIMLAATERGLATIPAVTLVHYPEILRSKLGIPDNLSIVLGIAIGYEDEQHPFSKFISTRRQVADVAKIKGIE